MNTDARERTARDLYELEGIAEESDLKNSMSRKEYLQYVRGRQSARSMGSGNVFNGSTRFINAMLTILCALIIAGIVGEVVLYGQVQAIAKTVDLIVAGKIK